MRGSEKNSRLQATAAALDIFTIADSPTPLRPGHRGVFQPKESSRVSSFSHSIGGETWRFDSLKDVMAKASPARSGDYLAGVAAGSDGERVAAQMCLADVPLKHFLDEVLIPYEEDEVTRLIIDSHDRAAFTPVSHLTVGGLRDWLLSDQAAEAALRALAPGLTPEMAAAVSKIMRVQDLILVAQKIRVVSRFRNTLGLRGRMSTRLQPNHPTDEPAGIAASILDGLLYGNGDAMLGINPASDSISAICEMLRMLDGIIQRYEIPTQACVLTHVTTSIAAIERGVPLDLVFQSIAGTEAANASFGISLKILQEGYEAALSLNRGTLGNNLMYFETGQGSALSAGAHHGLDQQTCETRAYAVARHFKPFLVNTVVGFIGPEYLYNGKQIIRAGLEDHFCAKLLGLPMGCDVCYTNHAEADQDDMDTLLTLFGVAGINFIMGIPGSDDVMLNYQTTSFHDALYVRQSLGLKPAPEFEAWLERMGIFTQRDGRLRMGGQLPPAFRQALAQLG
jgi:ethanolamine ammonia-lyase large subunit